MFLLSYKNSAIDDNEFSVPHEEFYPTNTSESPHVDRNQKKMKYSHFSISEFNYFSTFADKQISVTTDK